MKRILIACAVAAGLALAATGASAAGGHGGGGGGHWGGGGGGHWGGGGGHWSGGHGWHGSGWHGGHGGHSHFYGSVYVGWPWYWWGPAWYGYPPYYYDSYPAAAYYDGYPDGTYYDQPDTYIERPMSPSQTVPAPQPKAQYYCPDSGYYPSVQTCPRGWLRVMPGSPPPS